MISNCRAWLTIGLTVWVSLSAYAQLQDKEQSKAMVELAGEMLKASQAEDDVRDIMVQAADLDTTNIQANFEAARLHLITIKKNEAVKFLLRVYRQKPSHRFDLEYHIGTSYQYGLQFDKAIEFYNRYKAKFQKQPSYQGKDKVSLATIERKIYECNNGKEFVANPKAYAIVNMGPQINSEYRDYAPVLNEKEDEVIFTSRRRDGNINENVFSDNHPYEDIFISTKTNGKWSKAANIGRTINIPNHNSNLALSPDGKTLYQYRDDNGGDIFMSELKPDNTWSTPKPLPGIINSPDYEASVSVTPDGNILYFASDRPGGEGGLDIYMCTKDSKGNWSKVRNLGPKINTPAHEDGPFIDYSGKKLYFSSRSHKGMGGYDIFETDLINPAKNEWSEPLNLGYPINTPDDDIYYVGAPDGKRGYYASVRDDGLGYQDIYIITPKEMVKEPTKVLPLKLVVKVIDAKENHPLDATIELLSISEGKPVPILTQTKGNYTFTVTTKEAKNYRLSVRHDGYFPQIEEITLQSADMVEKTVTRTVGMAKSKKDPVILPLHYVVKVVDAKTNTAIDATVKLLNTPDNAPIVSKQQGVGVYEFSIISPTAKAYKLIVDKANYESQTATVNLEGASTQEKTVNKVVALTVGKLVSVPLKYVVQVLDGKTNLPLDAVVKLEAQPEKLPVVGAAKSVGVTEFSVTSTTAKAYLLTVEKAGYDGVTQTVNIEAAATTEKIVQKTLALNKKAPNALATKIVVKVVDEKSGQPLEVRLKLEALNETSATGTTTKPSGQYEFSVKPTIAKEFTLTAERDGYVTKADKFMVEAAAPTAKALTRTIMLAAAKKEPVYMPVTLTIKVVDEKTKAPLEAKLKLEAVNETSLVGNSSKAAGSFDFVVKPTTSKEFTLTVERDGYTTKSEKFIIDAAGASAKTIARTVELAQVVKQTLPTAFVRLVVNVIDSKTKASIEANVVLETMADDQEVKPIAKGGGVYEFLVTSTKTMDYELSADRQGYLYVTQKVRLEGATDKEKTVTRTLALQPIAVNATQVLKHLYFDVGKATIRPESYAELNSFKNMMQGNSTIRVEISGHTDNMGDDAFNMNLSQQRANAVKTYLTTKGIAASRLVAKGYGETRPLVSNDDEDGGREINRRVELKILSK